MDVKDAVGRAKIYVNQVFSDEGARNIGLEEVRFDDARNAWLITIGFSRPWDASRLFQPPLGREIDLNRTYKVVRISDEGGQILSVTDRTFEVVAG